MNKWNIKSICYKRFVFAIPPFLYAFSDKKDEFNVVLFNVKQNVYLRISMEIYTIRQKMSKKILI
ncbi:hypothetical protein COF67_22575 [Bacillus toyonensis]|nr:hypothetical protein DPQ31_27105 [Bacillus sp. COPE52]PDY89667.1 hypothetical protein CON67_14510 [Bacillus toyonensis]PHD46499.1 hypothetical protein COF67_22575 [Bacillus toyonensis]PRT16604.1 hypothetical protein C6353_15910 [Bacillus toyonensis]